MTSTEETSSVVSSSTTSTTLPPSDHHHNGDDESMHRLMEQIDQVSERSTLQHLIEGLRSKLRTLAGQTDSRMSTSATSNPTTSGDFSVTRFPDDGQLLHYDTIVLLVSCVVMIVLGLGLRKVFLYFTKLRSHREKYHSGLKHIADHVHTVTRTISNPIEEKQQTDEPTANNGNNNDDHVVMYHPSSGQCAVIRSPGGSDQQQRRFPEGFFMGGSGAKGGTAASLPSTPGTPARNQRNNNRDDKNLSELEARRMSKMHNFLVNYEH